MRVPSREYVLAPTAKVRDRDIVLAEWQAHVISHPLGLQTIRRGRKLTGSRHWDHEGWSQYDPPLLSEKDRVRVTKAIRSLSDGGQRCGVEELELLETSAAPVKRDIACYGCGPLLVGACAEQTKDLAAAYAALVDDTLGALEGGEVIRRQDVAVAIGRLRSAEDMPLVGTLGLLRNRKGWGLRFNRPDGVRVELRQKDDVFFWRTTYRNAVRNLGGLRAHLRDHLTGHDPHDPLSGKALVPRPWWQRNQP